MRYLYCHPLFDERKCAHRFSYQLKNTFEAAGLHLERFDYRGAGEAPGDFCDISLDSLLADTAQQVGTEQVCLIGLRFGASLALDYCARGGTGVRTLVLLEPVVDGAEYVDYLRRRQHIKDMLTGKAPDALKEEGYENIEGYKTSWKFLEEIGRFNLVKEAQHRVPENNVFIVQVSNGSRVGPDIARLAEVLQRSAKKLSVENEKLPVFWERIPSTDYSKLTAKILRWCCD
jgi:pimeloyl-ACP methyl ester carboxylesterase